MRAAWYERTGPARDVIRTGTLPDPEPGPGEVRVRLAVSGVNPSDWKARSGVRPMAGPIVVPHSDGAGVVDRVGPGVSARREGERVWVLNGQWGRPLGTAAEYVVLPEDLVAPLPDVCSFEEGACFGIPALTAWRAVTVDGSVEGRTVLVTGGAGSVGHYAVQFAKLLGAAKVFATVSSATKAEHARNAGADVVIDYRSEDVAARIAAETGGRGVDRIVEVDIATNGRLLPRLIAKDGLCAVYGSAKPEFSLEFVPLIVSGAAIRFFIIYELEAKARRDAIARMNDFFARGLVRHTIAARFPLEDCAAAHEAVEGGRLMGNVVLTI